MKASILDIAKRRGFFWPSFEIYQGLSGFYTYGPLGSLLKLRIEGLLRDYYINEEGCLLLDEPVLGSKDPWVASGHVESFTDMTVECQKCGEPYRADHLVEENTKKPTEGLSLSQIFGIIEKEGIKCPKCKGNLGDVYDYNLMFSTNIGPGKNKIQGYLRPETATTTYIDFRRLHNLARNRIPFGVIQVGKSFRNEISPRTALVRLREFHQVEVQFFIDPKQDKHSGFGSAEKIKIPVLTKQDQVKNKKARLMALGNIKSSEWIIYHLGLAIRLFERMGIDKKKMRVRQHRDDERSFYSKDTWDVEFVSENFGKIELVGIADRGDYDLKRHQELSKQSMGVNIDGKRFIPHVIEIAYGIDRPLLCVLESSLKQDGDRVYLKLPPEVAPYQVVVLPLVKKDGLPGKTKKVYELLKEAGFYVLYDEEYIGKAYYRQDEAGSPYCITFDYDSIKDKAVTIRNRDNQKQIRVKIKDLVSVLGKLFAKDIVFEKAGKIVK